MPYKISKEEMMQRKLGLIKEGEILYIKRKFLTGRKIYLFIFFCFKNQLVDITKDISKFCNLPFEENAIKLENLGKLLEMKLLIQEKLEAKVYWVDVK